MAFDKHIYSKIQQTLKEVFGYTEFKPLQAEIIQTILQGNNVFALMTTAAGKSLCYQIPAILSSGLTIVISPLISLMHDQVAALQLNSINAKYIDSSLNYQTIQSIYQQLYRNQIRLLYISPERLAKNDFITLLSQIKIDRFIIDEAHCISQWGHDFRKEYLNLILLAKQFQQIPRVALTATADSQTQQDIINLLSLQSAHIFTTNFNRNHFQYYFIEKNNAKKQLLEFIKRRPKNECGIVYCHSRNQTEHIAYFLAQQQYQTFIYHAGLDVAVRNLNQALFFKAEAGIMVATIAFGMGIDKSNIRFVAHLSLPQSIEHFFQESGRAGRDDLPAISWVCYGLNDFVLLNERIKMADLSLEQKQIRLQKLTRMLQLCDYPNDKNNFLHDYFNQQLTKYQPKMAPVNRHNELFDASLWVQQLLSCIYHVRQNGSIAEIIRILQGKDASLIEKYQLQNNKIFGIGHSRSTKFWRAIIRQSLTHELISITGQDQILHLTKHAIIFLRQKATLWFKKTPKSTEYHFDIWFKTEREKKLYYELNQFRQQLALEKELAAEYIFDDHVLKCLVIKMPTTISELSTIDGLGAIKINLIGAQIITICKQNKASKANYSHFLNSP